MESENERQRAREFQALLREIKSPGDVEQTAEIRKIIKARSAEIKKALRGLNHEDPNVRKTWHKYIGNKTPAETFDLVELMSDPPRKKGRPKGTGFEEADLELMPDIHIRLLNGETLKAVTRDLVDRMHEAGKKPSDGATVRLQRRYRDWLRTQKK